MFSHTRLTLKSKLRLGAFLWVCEGGFYYFLLKATLFSYTLDSWLQHFRLQWNIFQARLWFSAQPMPLLNKRSGQWTEILEPPRLRPGFLKVHRRPHCASAVAQFLLYRCVEVNEKFNTLTPAFVNVSTAVTCSLTKQCYDEKSSNSLALHQC